VKFHESLSERSVYLRYFQALQLSQRVTHERLLRRCFIDYDREMALVAETKGPGGAHELLAIARLIKMRGKPEAEFSILVADQAQRQGLGVELMKRLIRVARDEKLHMISADILRENGGMQRLCEKLGFKLESAVDEPTLKAVLKLS
ncbi:MAG TPA: GNAT family N-acetyltransferase, partial [Elusimicrobiota bacterium]|nr:GNAT family N-acetyltransferase [Elusimicrobiota bacterium]